MARSTAHFQGATGILLAMTLTGCQAPKTTPEKPQTAASDSSSQPAAPSATHTPIAAAGGPDMLSTVGSVNGEPLTRVTAEQGTFAITAIDGSDTLTLDGKPARYRPAGADAPELVAANSDIKLIGVFELPQESVAWVLIGGGTACAGTHVLVSARSGLALPGQEIPGCDDRGTMRRTGDRITFEAGGASGTYQDGMISVATKPSN